MTVTKGRSNKNLPASGLDELRVNMLNRTIPLFQSLPPVCEQPVQTECVLATWIWRLVAPILVLVGTVGNSFALMVLSRKSLRALPVVTYLLFLAVSDETFLITTFSRHFTLRTTETDIYNVSLFTCVVNRWLTFTTAGLSPWLLVLLTLERMYVTVYPIGRIRPTRKIALIACLAALAVVSLSNAINLYIFDLVSVAVPDVGNSTTTEKLCLPRTADLNDFYTGTWKLVVFLVYNLIPMCIIILGNAAILIKLSRPWNSLRNLATGASSNQRDKRNGATKMILIVSLFFVLTTIPYTSFAVINNKYFEDATDLKTVARLQLVSALTNMLLYCNFSFNFWIYFATGTLFKEEWKKIMLVVNRRCSSICITRAMRFRRKSRQFANQNQRKTETDKESGNQTRNNEQSKREDRQTTNSKITDDGITGIDMLNLFNLEYSQNN